MITHTKPWSCTLDCSTCPCSPTALQLLSNAVDAKEISTSKLLLQQVCTRTPKTALEILLICTYILKNEYARTYILTSHVCVFISLPPPEDVGIKCTFAKDLPHCDTINTMSISVWAMQHNTVLNPLRSESYQRNAGQKTCPPRTRMVFTAHTATRGTLHITSLAGTHRSAFMSYREILSTFK